MPSGQVVDALQDVRCRHRYPFVAVLGEHRIESVTPGTAIIAATRANKYSWPPDQWTFTLHRWPEDFADRNLLCHGRYSAQVFGVSLTRTAVTSGHRALHQS